MSEEGIVRNESLRRGGGGNRIIIKLLYKRSVYQLLLYRYSQKETTGQASEAIVLGDCINYTNETKFRASLTACNIY